MLTVKDIAWMAGFLEGEGCFQVGKANDNKSKSLIFKISVDSTDKDVMIKASTMLNSVCRLQSNGNGVRDGYARKVMYDTSVHGAKAIGWMMTIYPLMGSRRQDKIREIISSWKSYINLYHTKGFKRGPRIKKAQ